MRTYRQDSAQAAARIVAMAALSDGHMCSTEAKLLDNVVIAKTLGLQSGEWQAVLRNYCEDVLANEPLGWSAARPDAKMIAALLGEIQDPRLRRTVLDLCAAVTDADSHEAAGESGILAAAAAQWDLEAPAPRSDAPSRTRSVA